MKNNILQSLSWFKNKNVAVRGYCFDTENNFYEGKKMLDFFAAVKTENDFLKLLETTNGIFSVIIEIGDTFLAASDKSRIFPLFYSIEYQNFKISDNPYLLLTEKPEIDKEAETEYLLASFTLDEKTLIKSIFQVKPSCYLMYKKGKNEQKEYYFYTANKNEIAGQARDNGDFEKVLENVFRRLIQSVNGRQIVVPLSGGYDSRLIAAMLKKIGYGNVVCYTVGRENNPEYQIAKEVAKNLDYPYHFIFTGNEKFVKNYTADPVFQQYYKHSGMLCQSFWMYEYFGVKYLYDNNLIERSAIFIPGHSGDFLAGSQTTKMNLYENDSKEKLVKKLEKYFVHFGKPTKKYRKKLIQIFDFQSDKTSFSTFDDFILKHRLPFLPNNSARLYEFFGYDVRLPFWDNEMLEFFRTLPPSEKNNKKLYNNYLKNNLFKEFNVNFERELQAVHKPNPLQPLKDFIRPFLPKFMFRLTSKYLDDTCMKEIAAPLFTDLKKAKIKLNTIDVNEPYLKWYLYKMKKDLNIK